jgi:Protein of unknown function (DUF2695)
VPILPELSVPRATVLLMTDIRDANPHTDGFEPRPGPLSFGMSPDDTLYDGVPYEELDDWSDPDDEPPRRPLPLQPAQLIALARAIDAGLRAHGCDNTLRAARAWARREKVRWRWLRAALEDRGGFCDCEVVLNVVDDPG